MRRLILVAVAGAVSTGFLALFNEGAWAGGANYVGAAPPSVSCGLVVGVHFIPPITTGHPTPSRVKVNGTLSPCVAGYPGIAFTGKSHITVNSGSPFTPNPGFCGGAGSGGSFSVSWKGTFNGSIPSVGVYSGTAHFVPSAIGPETPQLVTVGSDVGISFSASGLGGPLPGGGGGGSFYGPSPPVSGTGTARAMNLSTGKTAGQIATLCAKGLKSIKLTGAPGSFTIGS